MTTNTTFVNFTGINMDSTPSGFYGLGVLNQVGNANLNGYLLITSTNSPGNLLEVNLGRNLASPSGSASPGWQYFYLAYTTYGMCTLYSSLSNLYYLYVARSGSIMRFSNLNTSYGLTSVTLCSISTLYAYTSIVSYINGSNQFLYVSATDGIYQIAITDSTSPTGTASLWATNAQINAVLTCGSSSIYGLAISGNNLFAMIKNQGIVIIQINSNNTLGTISIQSNNSLITTGSSLLVNNGILYIATQNTASSGTTNYGTGNIYKMLSGSTTVTVYKSNTYYPANSGLATDGTNLYLLCAGNSGTTAQSSYVSLYPLYQINIANSPIGFYYNNIDICNNFSSIVQVANPQYSGSNFSTKYFVNIDGTYYDLAQLYNINTTLIATPSTLTNMNTLYNGTYYDLNSFLRKPPVSVTDMFTSLTTPSSRCNACFSILLLNTSYSGFILKIRRADGTFMSFYSTSTGSLTNGSGTTIATFLSGSTGYVDTWYDQSGKGNNAYQTTTSSQPIFDVTNNCIDFGYSTSSNLFMNMPSGTVPVGVFDASYSFVVRHGNSINTYTGGFIGAGTFSLNVCNAFRLYNSSINQYANYWYNNDLTWGTATTTVPTLAAVTYNGTSKTQKGYVSALLNSTATARTGGTTAAALQTIGNTPAGTEYLKGQMYSLLIYSAELPQADITTIDSYISTSYTITSNTLSISGLNDIYTFTSLSETSILTITQSITVTILCVGGGGGGGWDAGGGGGGGGAYSNTLTLTAGTYTITIGAGGASSSVSSAIGSNGGNTSFIGGSTNIICYGGGGGGNNHNTSPAGNGGNGGGQGATDAPNRAGTFGTGISGQGNNGGAAINSSGGGGGGYSSLGGSATGPGGNGGNGILSSITGTDIWYGGGGGGGSWGNITGGTGGLGGGGGGGNNSFAAPNGSGKNATYYGGGGGGSGSLNGNIIVAGNGYQGICIISIPKYIVGSGLTLASINTSGRSLYYGTSSNGTTMNNPLSTTLVINRATRVKILMIGGGGCGGNGLTYLNGGGQGGNGVYADISLKPGTYTITIDSGTTANTTYGRGGSSVTFALSGSSAYTITATGGSGGQTNHSPGYTTNPSNGLTSPTTTLSQSNVNSYYYARGSSGQTNMSFAQSGYVIVPETATISGITKTTNTWYYPTGYQMGQTGNYVNYVNYFGITHEYVQDNYYYLPIDVNMFNDISSNTNTYKTYFQIGFGSGGKDGVSYPGYSDTNGYVYRGGAGGPFNAGLSIPYKHQAYEAAGTGLYSIGCGGCGTEAANSTVPTTGWLGGPAAIYLYF